ncbi:hypothetical protein ACH4YO_42190 [Streptomyces noursei]|uniref:hypothetical protein n=1 Tax=Streptomyces noursei TaxID=1971 RepID=UPI0033D1A754
MRTAPMMVAAVLSGIILTGSTGISAAQPVAPPAKCGETLDDWVPKNPTIYSGGGVTLTIKKDGTSGFSDPKGLANVFPNGTKFTLGKGFLSWGKGKDLVKLKMTCIRIGEGQYVHTYPFVGEVGGIKLNTVLMPKS